MANNTKKQKKILTSGKKYMTQVAYAEARNVKPPRITVLKREGVVIFVDGIHKGKAHKLIDVKATDKAIKESQDEARNDYRKFSDGSTPKPEDKTPKDSKKELTYKEATTKEKVYKAKLAELEYNEKKGVLVNAEDVKKVWTDHVISTKTRLRSIPTKTAQEITHAILHSKKNSKKNERELIATVQGIMQQEIDEVLRAVANAG